MNANSSFTVGGNNGGPNQWIIRVKITAWLLNIHLSKIIAEFQRVMRKLTYSWTDPQPGALCGAPC